MDSDKERYGGLNSESEGSEQFMFNLESSLGEVSAILLQLLLLALIFRPLKTYWFTHSKFIFLSILLHKH